MVASRAGHLPYHGLCTFAKGLFPSSMATARNPNQTESEASLRSLRVPPAGRRQKKPSHRSAGAFENPGKTYFHAFGTIIGSESLTTVFGMGTGVAFPIWSPGRDATGGQAAARRWLLRGWHRVRRSRQRRNHRCLRRPRHHVESPEYKWSSFRPLVPVSSARYRAYTSGLSTWSSSRGLSCDSTYET